MILGFRTKFPDGTPTHFVGRIKIAYTRTKSYNPFDKIHTIRTDTKNRWKPGRKIQMATGVRTKKYNCFNEDICKSVQEIDIKYIGPFPYPQVKIDGRILGYCETYELALSDGFDGIDAFCQWFKEDFTGKIIHWTDKRY